MNLTQDIIDNYSCTELEETVVCSANATYSFFELTSTISANLTCPRESVLNYGIVVTSQGGDCHCDTTILNEKNGHVEQAECFSYACPEGSVRQYGFECSSSIVGPCTSFNCDSQCNGMLSDDHATYVTLQPSDGGDGDGDDMTAEDSTALPHDCYFTDTMAVCPATSSMVFDVTFVTVFADMYCPIQEFKKSGSIVTTSQQDKCKCDAQIALHNDAPEDIQCHCYTCPQRSAKLFSYRCSRPIVGDCLSFDCDGVCNGGAFLGTGGATFSPTTSPPVSIPTEAPTSGASSTGQTTLNGWFVLTLLLYFCGVNRR